MQGEFSFYEKTWKNISSSAKDLISSLLAVDPQRRPNAEEVGTTKSTDMITVILQINKHMARYFTHTHIYTGSSALMGHWRFSQ